MKRKPPFLDLHRWQTYLHILSGKRQETSIRALLIKGTGGTFLVKAIHAGLLFLTALLLARFMGVQDYGTYVYILSWITLLLIPALFGMDVLLVRRIAIYDAHSEWALMKGIMSFCVIAVLAISIALAVFVGIVAKLAVTPMDLTAFWAALVLLPLLAMIRIQNGIMRGLHAVVRGQVPEFIIYPGALILVVIVAYYGLNISITPFIAVMLTIVCVIAALLISMRWVQDLIPVPSREAVAVWQVRDWLRSALPLVLIVGMGVINTRLDILMVGTMLDHASAGVYYIASQLSELVAFVLVAVNAALAPVIARLHNAGEKDQLQLVITKSTRFMLVAALPVALILAIFGDWILLLFGSEFTAGLSPLRFLVLGQIVNVMAGSVGWLLIMTGYERDAVTGISIGALVNICLNAVLIPVWGTSGAAIATAISMALWNVILVYFVFKRLGIYSFAFSRTRPAAVK